MYAFIAPKIIGGKGAPSPVGDLGKLLMSQAITLTATELQQIGEDWLISGYLPPTFS
jgi:diaminohydroxyphosphoribosylaminopyrimidine deaminase/5-amino-6-(5-phosphoribosylamino)uracil reductase